MRKITLESTKAFNSNQSFNKANMRVQVYASDRCKDSKVVELLLHGNVIARKYINGDFSEGADGIELTFITSAGWQTNTTKERLNGLDGVSICQKDFDWYLNGKLWDGSWTSIKVGE